MTKYPRHAPLPSSPVPRLGRDSGGLSQSVVEQRPDPTEEALGGEGLLEKRGSRSQQTLMNDRIVGVPRHEENPGLGMAPCDRSGEVRTVHSGQHDVRKEQVQARRVLMSAGHRFTWLGGFQHRVAVETQGLGDDVSNPRVILDQEHRLRSGRRWLNTAAHDWIYGLVHTRQVDFEDASHADFAVDIDVAAALVDDAVHRGKPESGSLSHLLGRIDGFEDTRLGLRIHPAARVGDRENDVPTRLRRRMV